MHLNFKMKEFMFKGSNNVLTFKIKDEDVSSYSFRNIFDIVFVIMSSVCFNKRLV